MLVSSLNNRKRPTKNSRMKNTFIDNLIAGSYSVLVHIVVLALFFIGLDFSSKPKQLGNPEVEIVQATALDQDMVDREVAKIAALEEQKRKAEEQRQQAVEEKLQEAQEELARQEQEYEDAQERAELEKQQREEQTRQEKERIAELAKQREQEEQAKQQAEQERKIAEEQRKAEEAAKAKAQEQRKVEEAAKEKAEAERKAAEEAREQAEAERKKAEAERQRVEDEKRQAEEAKKQAEKERLEAEQAKKKAEEEKRKAEEARKKAQAEAERKAVEQNLQDQLEREQQERDARRVKGVVDQYSLMIQQRVKRYWTRPANNTSGLQCTVRVSLMPGGDVKNVKIVKSSGSAVFDRSAEAAVYKAAPLPQPSDAQAAAALRDFEFIFKPE